MSPLRCVLIAPARNEEAFIAKTIQSMVRPDGSPDSVGHRERRLARGRSPVAMKRFMTGSKWVDMPERRDRSFAAKVHSFNAGYAKVKALDCEIIGNIDAENSFESDHLEFVLQRFAENPRLGVAGTVFEEEGYRSEADSFEGQHHVPGQFQLFRRQCFEEIGGYVPHRAGGIDWIAVTTARMKGWRTRSFREKAFFHHRTLGTAERGRLRSLFSYGQEDYYLGGHPLWSCSGSAIGWRNGPISWEASRWGWDTPGRRYAASTEPSLST